MAFILRRRAGLYVRIRIPSDLSGFLGSHIVRTLKTTDRRIGQTRGALFRAQSAAIFDTMKQETRALVLGVPIDELQQSDLVGCDRGRLLGDIETLTDDQRRLLKTRFRFLVERAERDLAEDRQGLDMAVDVLEALKSAKMAGTLEALQEPGETRQARKPAEKADKRTGLRLSELLDSYFSDRSLTTKSEDETRLSVRNFESKVGLKPIKDITNTDVATFKTWLQERPGNAGRAKSAHATVQKSLGHIKTVLKWATNEAGILTEVVGQNVQPRKKNKDEKAPRRLAFDTDALTKIFKSPIYSGCLSRKKYKDPGKCVFRDDKFYFFLTIFLTGARVEELPGAKISHLDGLPCLDLRETGTKTQAGARLIPILPALEKAGFTKWAEQRINDGGKLFEGLHASNRWSQWSNRYLDHIEVSDRLHTTYSLRHAFRQILRNSKLNTETIDKIFGHEGDSVGANYGRQLLTKEEARNFLDSVNPSIDLKHLYQK